jgi:hypothetical protein
VSLRRTYVAASALALLIGSRASAQPAAEPDLEVPAAPAAAPTAGDFATLKAELDRLRARVEELELREAATPATAPAAAPAGGDVPGWLEDTLGLSAIDLSAYVQAQYEWHQDSEDQLAQGGEPLNLNRFLVRRGRVRLDLAWSWSALSIELDGNTTNGPSFGLRRAEASLIWRGPWGPRPGEIEVVRLQRTPPLMMLSVGLLDIPFGSEVGAPARDRVFMERSTGSLALFPGEPDLGARLSGGASFFRYALAVLNGEPLDETNRLTTRDPNDAKDFVGRLGVDVAPIDDLRIEAGLSALRGEGFHAGTDSTKDSVQWRDTNENGGIDPGELIAAPGVARTPSESFGRWGMGADVRVGFETPLGRTTIQGEVTLSQNLDRGLFQADPVLTGIDKRELSVFGALVQELTPYALVALRVDLYDPNADFFDTRGGVLLPTSQAIRTISPAIGGGFPNVWRVVLQYDNVHDALTRDGAGVPADLANDRFTGRLQVSL